MIKTMLFLPAVLILGACRVLHRRSIGLLSALMVCGFKALNVVTTGVRWTQSTGTSTDAWAGDTSVATFQATGGTINVSGMLRMGGLTFKSNGYNLAGGSLTGAATTNPLTADPGVSATVGSVLAGPNTFSKAGSGTITLTGANTYTGVMNLTAGTLIASNDAALGTTGAGTTVNAGATLALPGGISIGAKTLTLSGTGIGAVGVLSNTAGANTYGGAITLAAPSTIGSTAGTLTLSSTLDNAGFGLTLDGAGNVTASGIISGAGALAKTGTGTALLSVANSYTGITTVSGGTLRLGINSALPATAVTVGAGTMLDINSMTQSVPSVNSAGTLALGTSGSLTLTSGASSIGAITGTGTGTITVCSGATLTLTAALSNSGVSIVLAGGTLNLGVFTHAMDSLSVTATGSTLDFATTGATQITAALLDPAFALSDSNWTLVDRSLKADTKSALF